MNEPFPILVVDPASRSDIEQLGSKPKFWFKLNGQNWLFKEARESTGEDWAEKISSEIALLLGLPCHHAELALYEGKRGCAVKSFLPSNQSNLIHGNELLGGLISGYDKEKQWGQADHTFGNIVRAIEAVFREDKARRAMALRMVGYLVLDALVGNTDRHHQNWGLVMERKQDAYFLHLAPTFDHASSLGRELTDEARSRHLQEGRLERYILKAPGGIFENPLAKRGLSPLRLAVLLSQNYPELFRPWQARVGQLGEAEFVSLVGRVPAERMSPQARGFVLAFLATTRKMISNIP